MAWLQLHGPRGQHRPGHAIEIATFIRLQIQVTGAMMALLWTPTCATTWLWLLSRPRTDRGCWRSVTLQPNKSVAALSGRCGSTGPPGSAVTGHSRFLSN